MEWNGMEQNRLFWQLAILFCYLFQLISLTLVLFVICEKNKQKTHMGIKRIMRYL